MSCTEGPQALKLQRHHGPFFVGEHVEVKHHGGGTVVQCAHEGQYPGRVEIRYDDDGSTYHCYPSKMRIWPAPKSNSTHVYAQSVQLSHANSAPTRHHGPFNAGEHVMVKSFGGATVVECAHKTQYPGRYEVCYDDDGSTYHCYPSKLLAWPSFPQPSMLTSPQPMRAQHPLPSSSNSHHGPFTAGEHVMVKHYGGATVVDCLHFDQYPGRVEVCYDDDGSTYHCYPSKLRSWPRGFTVPFEQRGKREGGEPYTSALGKLVKTTHHHDFKVGEHVVIKGYGSATIVGDRDVEGPYKDRYPIVYDDDGKMYHCYPSKIRQCPTDATVSQPANRVVAPEAPRSVEKEPFSIGELVAVKGYGIATVVGNPTDGKYAGRVKVRYNDGSTYHCFRDEVFRVAPAPVETQALAAFSRGMLAAQEAMPRQDLIRIGAKVMVKGFGEAVVVNLPTDGKYAGRVTIRYPNGTTYNCHRRELS